MIGSLMRINPEATTLKLYNCLYLILILISFSLLPSCKFTRITSKMDSPKNTSGVKKIDVQGHRGCRGLMPENTIPAFMKAMELGVSTLELDLVISKDRQVIVSHEPFFNHEISSIDGKRITEEAEKTHNIYQLTREELTKYDVGLMSHQRFPDQKNIPAQKPTLVELATAVHEKCKTLKIPLPYFNVEIKRVPEQDNIFHPEAKEFAELVIAAIYKLSLIHI